MVEEKKQVRFKLRITKKRMYEVVKEYFPGEVPDRLKDVFYRESRGKHDAWLNFHDSFGRLWQAYLCIFAGKPRLVFERWDGNRWQYYLDRTVLYPDVEYLDLLGMFVKY